MNKIKDRPSKMNEPLTLPTPAEMVGYLDRFVHGQARAKQDIAVAIYNHYLSQAYLDREGEDLGNHHILILGPTGSGKTYMVKLLADYLQVPFSLNSASSLVEVGYRGRAVEDIVKSLLERAENDPRKAQRGVIFLDEIDKIRKQDTGGQKDVSGEGVQNALLTLLDGRIVDRVDMQEIPAVDTRRVLFVCTGAFVGLEAIVERRLGNVKKQIGFKARPNENIEAIPDKTIYRTLCQTQTADLVEYGMIPEFIGRFATITVLHELGKDDLRAIITDNIEASSLAKQKKLALIHGIELEITSDALDAIADMAREMGIGARALHRLIGRAVDSVDHRWSELADQGVTKVVISRESVIEGKEPKLIRGKSNSQRIDSELRSECFSIFPGSPRPVLGGIDGARRMSEGISDTRGWTNERIWNRLEDIKLHKLEWKETKGTARKWWAKFEKENKHRPALILRLAEELANRNATITEFFLSYVYSNTDNIQANLHYLDYTRLKKEQEKKKSSDA